MGIVVHDSSENFKQNQESGPVLRYDEALIKRYRIKYSVPQQVRFGMLPYSALEEYERQKQEAQNPPTPETSQATEKETTTQTGGANDPVIHAFWEDDDGERERLSQDDYAKFLAEHSLDLGTAGAPQGIEALLAAQQS